MEDLPPLPEVEDDPSHKWFSDEDEYDENKYSVCAVPGSAPTIDVNGIENNSERLFNISQYKGRYLVIVFYCGGSESKHLVESFATIQPLLKSSGADLVFCSTDKASNVSVPLWIDVEGTMATLFDLFDAEAKKCLDGVVIIDDNGVIRHVVTSSLDPKELAASTVTMVSVFKKHKVDLRATGPHLPMSGSASSYSGPRVKIDPADLEKDWDVSTDPELLKVLNVAKLLGRTAPPAVKAVKKVPMFDLLPTQIRKLNNPRAKVKSVMASLQRNLAGYGASGDIPRNQKIQLENIMKKVMGVAYMPEELNGTFTTLKNLNTRDQSKFLDKDVFHLTYDDWMSTPGARQWSDGEGVFVNNYSNFLLWVNLEDQLRLVSVAKGQDLKYVLLRLQKAVARIEEALKMIISAKSCQQRGFTTKDGQFQHSRREVYGTGFEVVITMDLIGLVKAGMDEIDKARRELNLKIEKCSKGAAAFTVVYNQSPDDNEEDIVTKTVTAVDNLAKLDHEFQSKLGVKLTL